MALTPGTKLGPYEIQSPLGAGGMGEVYRALDTRLDRIVAIKVLASHLSSSPELKQRMEREARTISSLNHPNICHLYDIGSLDGTDYLVMEFLEGETLAERLRKGAMPLNEVYKIGIAIAEALSVAHRQGIVHRDLKPGNIMLTPGGAKLMDFGLAKPLGAQNTSSAAAPPSFTAAATLSGPSPLTPLTPLTTAGSVIGTIQYMSPEQIEGKEADARSDIFAFGAVLYEMVTGNRPFHGKSQISLASAILEKDPEPVSTLKPSTPPAFEHVLTTCLQKDPEDRFQTAHDVKLQLRWIADGGAPATAALALVQPTQSQTISQTIAWAVAAICLLAAVALSASFWLRKSPPTVPLRASLLPPKNTIYDAYSFAISPDGKRLAFIATSTDKAEGTLWVRPLNSTSAQEISGTEGAIFPFWSPDSSTIGFFAKGKLKKIDAGGGPMVALADVFSGRGGSWSSDGTIIFSPRTSSDSLYQVSSSGGPVSAVTHFNKDRKEDSHRFPWFMPDGRHFVFYISSSLSASDIDHDPIAGLYFHDMKTGSDTRLVASDSFAQFANGRLFYLRQRNLMAQPFDPSSGKLLGPPVPVAQSVTYDSGRWVGAFSVSSSGVLGYVTGTGEQSQLIWYGRDGKELEKVGSPNIYYGIALSPDNQPAATSIGDPNNSARDLWIDELVHGTLTRLTFEKSDPVDPVWTHDGKSIAYFTNRGGDDIYQKASSGLGGEQAVVQSDSVKYPCDWTSDGRLLYMAVNPSKGGGGRLWIHQDSPEKKDSLLLSTNFSEEFGRFSPDGRWLAYVSEETGKDEIFVVPFPSLSSKFQVSTAGGEQVVWRGDGKEIFYVSPDRKIMAVSVEAVGDNFKATQPHELFTAQLVKVHHTMREFDVTRDGQRFLANIRAGQNSEPITIYANWESELKK